MRKCFAFHAHIEVFFRKVAMFIVALSFKDLYIKSPISLDTRANYSEKPYLYLTTVLDEDDIDKSFPI